MNYPKSFTAGLTASKQQHQPERARLKQRVQRSAGARQVVMLRKATKTFFSLPVNSKGLAKPPTLGKV
jgi:hypothetical protein